ncbi:fumarate reductase iron-sulfur subunit [bacterium]|nr:fumarate reductase iron-sulfur subunit [bacterium]MBU1995059.1 fumarate reductase iron-sulfur subunit [bacterium]
MSPDLQETRILNINILRFDPYDSKSVPHIQTFKIKEAYGMTLYIVLNEIREHHDNSLMFDFVCRAGICGSCSMLVNGRPTLACRTLTSKLPQEITLAPLPLFKLIKDLSIYSGEWMRGLNERLETWIHDKEEELNIDKLEQRMEPELADSIYELERCVECGCCVAGCGTIQMRPDFAGAVGLNKIARYHLDPRDKRSDEDYYELVGNEDGVFGCMTLLGCEDVCPKDLPLQSKIAYLRRMMIKTTMA